MAYGGEAEGQAIAFPSVKELADTGISEIPPEFIQLQVGDKAIDNGIPSLAEVPMIDMSGIGDESPRVEVLAEIKKACEEWGFFQVINHGISGQLLKDLKDVSIKFFALPAHEKRKYSMQPKKGIPGYGCGVRWPGNPICDWKEGMVQYTFPPSLATPADLWPTNPPEYRDTVMAYAEQSRELAFKILSLISESIGLPPSYFNEALGGNDIKQEILMNYYPPCPQPGLTFGLRRHSDFGLLTVLLQDDDVSGLEVYRDGTWVKLNPVPGALVVNLGDQAQVMFNDRYKSVDHRAVVNSSKPRLSIATFFNPLPDAVVGPIPELVDGDHPTMYRNYVFKEYQHEAVTKGPSAKDFLKLVVA